MVWPRDGGDNPGEEGKGEMGRETVWKEEIREKLRNSALTKESLGELMVCLAQ